MLLAIGWRWGGGLVVAMCVRVQTGRECVFGCDVMILLARVSGVCVCCAKLCDADRAGIKISHRRCRVCAFKTTTRHDDVILCGSLHAHACFNVFTHKRDHHHHTAQRENRHGIIS